MDTLYKQSLAACVAAALAFGCGSSDQQKEPAREPSASMTSTTETTASTTTPSAGQASPATANATPQQPEQPSTGSGGPQDTTGLPTSSQNADQSTEPTSTTTTMPATIDTNVTTLSDGEVFAIESSLNKGEMTLADLAKKKAASGEVKTFATTLATHHRDAQAKAAAVAQKEKIAAAPSDATKKLESDVSTTAADLKDKKGRDFDTAYIDSQVRMHRDAGTLIDSQLLPSVKSAALKDQLTTLRTTVAGHLSKAQEIQSHLAVVGTSSPSTTAPANGKAKNPPTPPKMSP